MRVSKSHRKPYRGFAWGHPLRRHFRRINRTDPAISEHKLFYSMHRPLAWIWLCYLLTCLAAVAADTHILSDVIVVLSVLLVSGVCVSRLNRAAREPARRFERLMAELAKSLRTSENELAAQKWDVTRRLAVSILIKKAATALKVRREESRARAHEAFEFAYVLFSSYTLIQDIGRRNYFNAARRSA